MTRVSNVLEVCRGEKPNNTTGQLKYSMRVTLNTALKTQTLYTKL